MAFIICYAPFHLQRLISSSSNALHLSLIQRRAITILYFISGIFYYLGSTINPIFYHLFSHKYREAWIRTMKRIIHCQCKPYHHHRQQSLHRSNQNNNPKAYTSPVVPHVVLCARLPRSSVNVSNKTKTCRAGETFYRSPKRYRTSVAMNCNRQNILRFSLPTFNTERVRLQI